MMNEYIIYTPEGHTTAPNENIAVENCQVLGIAGGKDESEAKTNLLNENTWITKAGFDPTKFMIRKLAVG